MLLDANPFHVLGVSTRDGRHAIMERADGMSLTRDQALCARCASELINPRQRLQCEVAWLPGVSPGQARLAAEAALKGSRTDPLPSPLAQANILVTMLAHQGREDVARLPGDILGIAQAWDRVETEEVRVLVNGDRRAAGFALAEDPREIERVLHTRMDAICSALATHLRGLPEGVRVQALTQALDVGTASGTAHGPMLLHAVMDAMSSDLRVALDREYAKVTDAIEVVRQAAAGGQNAPLQGAISALTALLREWDRYAQPLQLSAKSRGQDHQSSRDVAHEIRELAVFLHNKHSATKASQRITELLQEVFAEVPTVIERAEEDLSALSALIAQDEASQASQAALQNMKPIASAPTMWTINGFGTRLYGRRDEDVHSGTYVTTLYLVALFVPLIPLGCYRVRDGAGGGWHFLGSVPFSNREKYHLWGVAAAIGLWMLVSASSPEPTNPYNYQAPTRPYNYQAPTPSTAAPSIVDQMRGATGAAPTPTQPPPTPSATEGSSPRASDYFTDEPSWVGAGRVQLLISESELTQLKTQLQASKDELEQLQRKIRRYELSAPDGVLPPGEFEDYQRVLRRHNNLVDAHNALLEDYRAKFSMYERDLAAFNERIDRYNQSR